MANHPTGAAPAATGYGLFTAGGFIVAGGILLAIPGFLTDAAGVLLLIPFIQRRVAGPGFLRRAARDDVIDLDAG